MGIMQESAEAAVKKLPRIVDVVAPTYQPSKAQLEDGMRVRAIFEKTVEALSRPVTVRYIARPTRRPEWGRFGTFLHNPLSLREHKVGGNSVEERLG